MAGNIFLVAVTLLAASAIGRAALSPVAFVSNISSTLTVPGIAQIAGADDSLAFAVHTTEDALVIVGTPDETDTSVYEDVVQGTAKFLCDASGIRDGPTGDNIASSADCLAFGVYGSHLWGLVQIGDDTHVYRYEKTDDVYAPTSCHFAVDQWGKYTTLFSATHAAVLRTNNTVVYYALPTCTTTPYTVTQSGGESLPVYMNGTVTAATQVYLTNTISLACYLYSAGIACFDLFTLMEES